MTFMAAEDEKQSVVLAIMLEVEVMKHLICVVNFFMYFQSNIIPTLESDANKIMVFVISITSFHLAISKHLQAFINSQYLVRYITEVNWGTKKVNRSRAIKKINN